MKLIGDSAELHCEVIGDPIPEVQWWFVEGEEPYENYSQLFDGAREERVQINATYVNHATSALYLSNLTLIESGTYECRASNDPHRNDLRTTPKIKWIRSQANVLVFDSECRRGVAGWLAALGGETLLRTLRPRRPPVVFQSSLIPVNPPSALSNQPTTHPSPDWFPGRLLLVGARSAVGVFPLCSLPHYH